MLPKEWVAASLLPGIGPATLFKLYQQGIRPLALLENQLPTGWRLRHETYAALARKPHHWLALAESLLVQAEVDQQLCLCLEDPRYPARLLQLPDPPPLLWVRGDHEILHWPQIAVVGSRRPSFQGQALALEFGQKLTQRGLILTSGLALGVDSQAHRASIEEKMPGVAVLGSSLDQVYPRRNLGLAQSLLEQGGCLVSEWPPGTPPVAQNFPKRNRILSGLSLGVLVVEAAELSGSLITARLALEQGREVFALPGSLQNPMSRGCLQLIREGAELVYEVEHLLTALAPGITAQRAALSTMTSLSAAARLKAAEADVAMSLRSDADTRLPAQTCVAGLAPELNQVLDKIEFSAVSLDELCERLQWPFPRLQQALMELELLGYVRAEAERVERVC